MRFATIPCCCGGEDCLSFEDDFQRPGPELGANWVVQSGNWEIQAGLLVALVPGAENGIVTISDPMTDENVTVTVEITFNNDDDLARIILDYDDNDNYYFAEFKGGGGGYMRLYRRQGGIEAELAGLDRAFDVGVGHVLTACISGSGRMSATTVDGAVVCALTTGTSGVTGSGVVGLGTGSEVDSSIYFNDFSAEDVRDGCAECPACCACCEQMCRSYTVDIPDGIFTGTCCEDLDGMEYVLDWIGAQCVFEYQEFPEDCSGHPVRLTVGINFHRPSGVSSPCRLFVAIVFERVDETRTTQLNWALEIEPDKDCRGPFTVPYLSQSGGFLGDCDPAPEEPPIPSVTVTCAD